MRAPCGVTLAFFSSGGISDPRVWSQLDWFNSRPGGCKWLPLPVMLAPGETRVSTVTVQVDDVLGDSLPESRYGVAAVVAVAAPALRLAVVEGGEAELRR